jgi:peptidoglycan/LPS O-acetylase OafA/YrhL
MTLIGTMCYSIYLVHVVVIEAFAHILWHIRLTEPAEIWGLYIVVLGPVSLCVSGLFYIAIERPFMTSDTHLPGASFFKHRSKSFLLRCRALLQHHVS